MCRFLKCGPMNLVPRKSYGLGFFILFFIVAGGLIAKGVLLAFQVAAGRTTEDVISFTTHLLIWIATCVLPSMFYVSTLRMNNSLLKIIVEELANSMGVIKENSRSLLQKSSK